MATYAKERTLLIREFVTAPSSYHIARLTLTSKTPEGIHDSDFHEIFWVESGSGTHWINGVSYPLEVGDIVFVRPDDFHSVHAAAEGPVGFVNIAFPSAKLDELTPNIRASVCDLFQGAAQDRHYRLEGFDLHRLASVSSLFELPQKGDAELQLLLLLVGRMIERSQNPAERSGIPDWFDSALSKLRDPDVLRMGTPELIRLAGRGADHVARVCRKHLGKTPTEVVNELRLERAAQRLAQTAVPIDAIAEECGMPNLSYFYKKFSQQHGMTPGAYRKSALKILGAGAHHA